MTFYMRRTWAYNIKMDLKELCYGDVNWLMILSKGWFSNYLVLKR